MNPERRRPTHDPRAPQGTTPVARIESLGLLRRACWLELERAAQERDHGWRTLALATVDADRADARVVILREVDAAAQCLRFYTDARSADALAALRDAVRPHRRVPDGNRWYP